MNIKKRILTILQKTKLSYEELEWELPDCEPEQIKDALSELIHSGKIKEWNSLYSTN